ncbi:peptidoglycan D,D-transpeptidase FtsI family protein [Sporosarcina aquimarina]|uniref:Penicillin-binding protein 2 n=1 Tax=Sporosarcina aquimarina TaxID=114975 RepID=A0ABU4FW65_9BACL|nr:penicillin-binding protein 2 [Sporosarcina aquimarina]MDW0108950.1 penicillin-binding protein 2 [Sporosarcina aquimarina]
MRKNQRKVDQAKVRQRKLTSFRMNFLFFSIFVLFSLLIFRLGYLQIVKGEDYKRVLERTEEIAVNTSVPRGRIFDRSGHLLVDNEPRNAITYTKTTSTTSKEMLKTAKKLAKLIEKPTKRVTLGDKKDYWILLHSDEAFAKVTKKERLELENDESLNKKEAERKITTLTRDRITDEELNSLTESELEVLAIYREMMSGYAYTPQIVKSEDVSDKEFATVSEHLGSLPGVNTTTDWERVKMSDSAILGSTTSPVEGIPKTDLDYFLSRGYSRNDRVGKSYIESYYEDLLKGQKTVVKNIKDRTGKVVETKTVREGEPGKDLMLTIDTELQAHLEKIVEDNLLKAKRMAGSKFLDRAFFVMMDPNTGEVLSMVGKKLVTDKETGKINIKDYTFGTFSTSYEAGSTVKLATLLTGYQYGAAKLGEVKIDEPIYFKGSRPKSSLFNQSSRIPINDVEAIGRSSNVYMFKIAMKIANYNYVRGSGLRIDFDAFNKMRDGYASFGLGNKTGIDLPGEITGSSPEPNRAEPGKLLDLAIGQYDTYTPLQLAQYVSTVANGGYRIAPRVLKSVYEPSKDGKEFGSLIQQSDPVVLNRINNSDEEINRVKKGMYYTYYGPRGTARDLFKGEDFDAGGKTGTAQSGYYEGEDRSVWGTPTVSVAHVGFAPFDNPEIAYAVIVPHVSTSTNPPHPNNDIVQAAVKEYFALKKKRAESEIFSTETPTIQPPYNAAADEKSSK